MKYVIPVEKVEKQLRKLDTRKAPGPDSVPSWAQSGLPSFSFWFATPEERLFKSLRLLDSENLVSRRAAMSMLDLASSIATSVVRRSG